MPLVSLPTISSITKTDDGSNTIVLDSTVYGGANAARNTVAVSLLASKIDADNQSASLVLQDYDPAVVTQFTITNTIDGHQRFAQLIVPQYSSGVAYDQYNAVYDTVTDKHYQSNSVTPITNVALTDPRWEEKTVQELYDSFGAAEEPENVIVGIVETVLTFKSSQCLGDLASKNAQDNCAGCGPDKSKDEFDTLWLLVFAANVASERGKFLEGERMMRVADNYCDCDCGC